MMNDERSAVSVAKTTAMRQRILLILLVVSIFVVAGLIAACRKNEQGLTVSAASDLMPAFQEIGRQFEREHGVKVTFNFGSTGQLAQQIEEGAPVDLFAAANASFVDDLEKQGLIAPGTKANYAVGRITLWTRRSSQFEITRIEDLVQDGLKRIAIANPVHAPYGIAAREALMAAGIWTKVEPRLVYGENIRQTLQYAETGDVDVAIIALSLSIVSDGRWILIPEAMHKPIIQTLAVIKTARSDANARSFAAYVNSGPGRDIMRRYGFVLPGEEPLQ
jgi:molybdate transport system substrate-binding protein